MKDSVGELREIYIRLLGEGAEAWRPTRGRQVGPMIFVVQATPDYDPEDEEWEFAPNRVVRCQWERKSSGLVFIATEPANPPLDLAALEHSVLTLSGRSEPGYAEWIETRVNGTLLEQLVVAAPGFKGEKKAGDYQGSDSHDLVPPHGRLLGGRGKALLLVCAGCREPGCDPVTACIELFDRAVVWSEFEAGSVPGELSLTPLVFERSQYEQQVAALANVG